MSKRSAKRASAARIALDTRSTAAERYDATAEVQKSTLADLIPRSDIQPVIDHINSMGDDGFTKALIRLPGDKKTAQRGSQSVLVDTWQVSSQGQYWDRPGLLNFDSMRAMVAQTPILNSIIQTRIRQVSRFCRPQMNRAEAGFVIEHVDKTKELGDAELESIKLLQSFITNCGWETDPRRRKRLGRANFGQFMAKSVRDTLTMDAAPIETEFMRNRSLGIDGFYALDGATIRLCTEEGYEGDDEVFAVQVIQGNIRGTYNYDELVYEVRNPQTDVTACGYGYSETEMLIRVVTYMLNAMTYNGSFFDKNAIPRGILNIYGNYDQSDVAAFKRYWNSMARGIQNAHNLPVLVSKDQESGADFTEVGGQLNDIAFGKWLTFLGSVACSIYGIAPEDISMESFSPDKSSLGGSDTKEKIASSNDKGLRPLLTFYENTFSDYILQTSSPNYNMRFVGLDIEDAATRQAAREKVITVNEGRQAEGYDPLPGQLGDAPLNAALVTPWMTIEGIGQPEPGEEEQGDFGNPDAANDPPPGDDGDPGQGEADGSDAPGGEGQGDTPDFGSGEDEDMAKALDFGMPVYRIAGWEPLKRIGDIARKIIPRKS